MAAAATIAAHARPASEALSFFTVLEYDAEVILERWGHDQVSLYC